MTRVMIAGSRRISRLDTEVQRRIDHIIQNNLFVLIGDANGADKAVQNYLRKHGHEHVEVFCMEGICRNNLGGWPRRAVASPGPSKDFSYYATKDKLMVDEASIGLMIWDGQSSGTLASVFRLISQQKKAVVYIAPEKQFWTLKDQGDWEKLILRYPVDLRGRIEQNEPPMTTRTAGVEQPTLF